jgi:hypothetical protein
VQCFPLYTVLAAVGNPKIDLLSLDIEGAELEVSLFFLLTLEVDCTKVRGDKGLKRGDTHFQADENA